MHKAQYSITNIVSVIAFLLILVDCTKGHDGAESDGIVPDIKQATARVMDLAAGEPERALEVIDSLRAAGLPDYQSDLLRVRVYSQGLEGKMLDSAIVIGERLMLLDVAQENLAYRQDLLETLVNACRLRHDDEQVIRWSGELVVLCREKGMETEALRNEAEMGLFLTHVGRKAEGVSKIDGVLAKLDNVRKFNELDAWVIAAKRKIALLRENDGHADVIPVAHHIIDRLTDYEQHPDDYRDDTYREPSDEDRQGYIDFYRAQAYGFLAEAYARGGENQKAQECLERFEKSDYGQTLDGRKMIAPTWCLLGETQKLDAMYEDLTTARFRDYEQNMEIERQKADAVHSRQVAFGLGLLAVLLLTIIAILTFYQRVVRRKNRILSREISELLSAKEQLKEKQQTVIPIDDTTDPSVLSDADLFQFLSVAIEREQLFLNPACDRQMLTERFSLPKERIGNAFVRGGGYKNVSAYVNTLRLDFAAQMLTDRFDLDISQVALASGFSSHRYFSTCFKQHFGLSPSDYREARRKQS
ncbi:MAG: AraC family transcriptional regulator [Prevotella sp.]|nr:AraC family transcriptional regulator [Prevotella sp.]